MRIALFLLALVLLAACTTSRPMMAPSGAQGYKIWCEMPSQCYSRAAQQCPYGYTIEASEKDYWGLGDIDGNLFIVCKTPEQAPSATPTPAAAAPVSPATDAQPSQAPREMDPAKRCDACGRIGTP